MGPITSANSFYRNLYQFFDDLTFWGVSPVPSWLAYFLAGFLIVFIVVNAVVIVTTLGTWVERRLIGRIQSRLGTQPVGALGTPHARSRRREAPDQGGHQARGSRPLDIQPGSPCVYHARNPGLRGHSLWQEHLRSQPEHRHIIHHRRDHGADNRHVHGGLGIRNRYSLFGAMRGVAQLISYEVPMVLSIVGVLLLAGSLSLVDMVEAQTSRSYSFSLWGSSSSQWRPQRR